MRRLLLIATLATLCACGKKTEPPPAVDGGIGLDDGCASVTDAATDAKCTLALGQQVQGFIFPSGNHDWYHLKVDTIPARALLQVTGAYSAPSSPVTLQVLVYQGDAAGTASSLKPLGNVSDSKPRGAPAPVSVVSRISEAGDYYVLLEDDTSDNDDPQHGDADAKHQYTLTASVSSDPDTNEPNDDPASATAIALSGGTGTATGYLATAGDVDVYSVDASSLPSPRSVLYVGVDAPDVEPPSQIRIEYRVDLAGVADGGNLGGGWVQSPVGEQKAGTAKLLPTAGKYLVSVYAHKDDPVDPTPAPGDPRLKYTVTVKLLDDADTNEPNDTASTASPVNLALNSPQTVEGRIGYIPDFDWYALNVPGSGSNTRIHYKLTWDDSAPNSKRFPEVGNITDHQLTLVTLEPDSSTCMATCPTDPNQYDNGCNRTPSQCIYSYRLQDLNASEAPTGVENFEGTIPVPAGGARTYHLLVDDLSNDGADDRAYSLQLEWQDEASDESGAYHDTAANAVAVSPPVNGSYAADPGGAASAQGYISYGLLRLANDQAQNAPTLPINGSSADSNVPTIDYDGLNDADVFKLALPTATTTFGDGGTGPAPLSWSSAWSVQPAPGQQAGQRPYDLAMTYYFCDVTENPGCDTTSGRWHAITIAYGSGPKAGWTGSDQPGWDVDQSSGRFVTRANECFCVEPRFLAAGVAYLQVSGISRTSYGDGPYTVNTAFGPYPQSYTASDGSTKTCPVDGTGSCHFCDQLYGACQGVDGLNMPSP